jgi:hypothetical protein
MPARNTSLSYRVGDREGGEVKCQASRSRKYASGAQTTAGYGVHQAWMGIKYFVNVPVCCALCKKIIMYEFDR